MTPTPTPRATASAFLPGPLLASLMGLVLAWPAAGAWSQTAPRAPAEAAAGSGAAASAQPAPSSRLDAPLFYQLLIGELELRQGQPATAYAVLLDAARRTRDESLYERAVDIALKAQAGNEALVAATAWRQALPASLAAVRAQVRILLALNRLGAMGEPLRRLIELTPDEERPGTIAALPRLLRGHPDPRAALQLMQSVLIPLAERPATRIPAQLALARALMQAGQSAPALALARDVAQRQPDAPGPALLALEMLDSSPESEALVLQYLGQAQAEPQVRQSYAQWLALRQRHGPALVQLQRVTQALPESAGAWFQLGVVAADIQERAQATAALQRFLDLDTAQAQAQARVGAAASTAVSERAGPAGSGEPEREDGSAREEEEAEAREAGRQALQIQQARRNRARLLLSQLAIDQGDFAAAQRWLQAMEGQAAGLEVQSRRALILARQGKLDQARALIRSAPQANAAEALGKLLAEAQLLRTLDRWKDARSVLMRAREQHPQDTDVLYELALVLERMGQHEEMERHLRRILELRPDHHHAYNALGYSLAERGVRLEEAQRLIERALELAPGDPFITDSMGWVLFRQGQAGKAVELLRQAYEARPDTEIGVHLGEVLWSLGQRDEARRIWRASRDRDAQNKLLRDTLARIKVDL
ncbi:MAG: tetratricopeptide repeat protein [Betaproteobacteria bacterium]